MPRNTHRRSQQRKYYIDVALAMALPNGRQTLSFCPIGSQTTAIWLVFPEDLEEAAEIWSELYLGNYKKRRRLFASVKVNLLNGSE